MAGIEEWVPPKLAKHALSLSAQVSSGTGGLSDIADNYFYGDDGATDSIPGDPTPVN